MKNKFLTNEKQICQCDMWNLSKMKTYTFVLVKSLKTDNIESPYFQAEEIISATTSNSAVSCVTRNHIDRLVHSNLYGVFLLLYT